MSLQPIITGEELVDYFHQVVLPRASQQPALFPPGSLILSGAAALAAHVLKHGNVTKEANTLIKEPFKAREMPLTVLYYKHDWNGAGVDVRRQLFEVETVLQPINSGDGFDLQVLLIDLSGLTPFITLELSHGVLVECLTLPQVLLHSLLSLAHSGDSGSAEEHFLTFPGWANLHWWTACTTFSVATALSGGQSFATALRDAFSHCSGSDRSALSSLKNKLPSEEESYMRRLGDWEVSARNFTQEEASVKSLILRKKHLSAFAAIRKLLEESVSSYFPVARQGQGDHRIHTHTRR
ncbi:hypothetical protein JCM10213_001667 [Rhodosporidiobolus nylandii]